MWRKSEARVCANRARPPQPGCDNRAAAGPDAKRTRRLSGDHDRRNGCHVDGANGRPPGSTCGRHVAPPHVRNRVHAHDPEHAQRNDDRVCNGPGSLPTPQSCVHPHGHHACDVGAHRAGNRHDHRALPRCGRIPDRAHAGGWHGYDGSLPWLYSPHLGCVARIKPVCSHRTVHCSR